MSNPQLADLRENRLEICRKFVRTAVVVDDDIPMNLEFDEDSLFPKIAEQFGDRGILTHLFPYPNLTAEDAADIDNPSTARATSLALAADVTLLDWHLGGGAETDSTQALEIVKALKKSRSRSFLVILTKFPDEVESNLNDMFDEELKDESSEDGEFKWYGLGASLSLTVVEKPEANDGIDVSDLLLSPIYDLMLASHPDQLDWAIFELSTITKTRTPEILASLPSGTNGALFLTALEEEHPGSTCEAVARSYLDDLGHLLTDEKLTALGPDQVVQSLDPNEFPIDFNEARRHVNEKIRFSGELKGAITTSVKSGTLKSPTILLASYFESVQTSCEYLRIEPGTVLTPLDTANDHILICISPACDCVRNADKGLLYLKGKAVDSNASTKAGITFAAFPFGQFAFEASSLKSISTDVSDEGIKLEGCAHSIKGKLRSMFTQRLIRRVMAQVSRVGVDTASYIEKLRKED